MRFHFTEWGDPDAPAVLLLHGGNQSGHSWDLVSLHLSDRYHVFALDQRGHGDTEWSRDHDYSIDAKAADALAFVEDQELEYPVIIGHSMGGRVTINVAARGARRRAGGWCSSTWAPSSQPEGVKVIANFVTHNVEFDDLDVFLDNVVNYDRVPDTRAHRPHGQVQPARSGPTASTSARSTTGVSRGRSRNLTLDDVTEVPCPVLLVRGGESAHAARRGRRALHSGTPERADGDGPERRAQRARWQHARVPRGDHTVSGVPGLTDQVP